MKIPSFQINIVSVYKFLKKIKDEKFKINSIIRGNLDPIINIPSPSTGDCGDRTKDGVILKDRRLDSGGSN